MAKKSSAKESKKEPRKIKSQKKSLKKTKKKTLARKLSQKLLEQDLYEESEISKEVRNGSKKRSREENRIEARAAKIRELESEIREIKKDANGKTKRNGNTKSGTKNSVHERNLSSQSESKRKAKERLPVKLGRTTDEPKGKKGRKQETGKTSGRKLKVVAPLQSNRASKAKKTQAKKKSRKASQMPTRPKKDHAQTIVPLNPATGKEIKKPKTGQNVIFGIKDKRGKITKIESRFHQSFSKEDQNGLQKIIDRTGKKGFVIYEQLTAKNYEDPKTGLIYKVEKITFGKKGVGQRPILYANGKRVRELDLGFRKRSKREMVDDLLLHVIKPDGKFVRDIHLEGDTIKDTIKNLAVKLTMAQIKNAELEGLYYEIVLRVRGEEPIIVYGKTETYANMTTDIARSIRFTLANRGLRFTSLLNLQELASDAEAAGNFEMANKILKVGKDRIPVESLNPIFPENEFGYDEKARQGTGMVSMDIKISGIG